jgi:YgiT-type zinc finger domain-containing protein
VNTPGGRCLRGALPRPKTIADARTIDGKVSIVEDVPTQVCPQCGETYLSL